METACLELLARWDKADLARARFNPTDLPAYLEKCGALIQSHETAWKMLQELLCKRSLSDLTNRIDAIRQGDVDVGRVTGQEAREIFANASSRRSV